MVPRPARHVRPVVPPHRLEVDREAFAELVRRYQTPVYNFAYRQLGTRAAAEDVQQQLFLRLIESPPGGPAAPGVRQTDSGVYPPP